MCWRRGPWPRLHWLCHWFWVKSFCAVARLCKKAAYQFSPVAKTRTGMSVAWCNFIKLQVVSTGPAQYYRAGRCQIFSNRNEHKEAFTCLLSPCWVGTESLGRKLWVPLGLHLWSWRQSGCIVAGQHRWERTCGTVEEITLYLGNVGTGSLFAALQSAGAAGMSGASTVGVAGGFGACLFRAAKKEE